MRINNLSMSKFSEYNNCIKKNNIKDVSDTALHNESNFHSFSSSPRYMVNFNSVHKIKKEDGIIFSSWEQQVAKALNFTDEDKANVKKLILRYRKPENIENIFYDPEFSARYCAFVFKDFKVSRLLSKALDNNSDVFLKELENSTFDKNSDDYKELERQAKWQKVMAQTLRDMEEEKKADLKFNNAPISFKGNEKPFNFIDSLKAQIEKLKKNLEENKEYAIVDIAAVAAAGQSFMAGETSSLMADTLPVAAVQLLMTLSLAKQNNIDTLSALIFLGREGYKSHNIRLSATKALVAGAGVKAHLMSGPATGGATHVPISLAVRSINAGLTFLTTASMGRTFVKDVYCEKLDRQHQLVQSVAYVGARTLVGVAADIASPENVEQIKNLIDIFPKDYASVLASLYDTAHEAGFDTLGGQFTASLITTLSHHLSESHEKFDPKKDIPNILFDALLTTVAFNQINNMLDLQAADAVQDKVNELKAFLADNPEIEHSIKGELAKTEIARLSTNTREVINAFKDKTVLQDLLPVVTKQIIELRHNSHKAEETKHFEEIYKENKELKEYNLSIKQEIAECKKLLDGIKDKQESEETKKNEEAFLKGKIDALTKELDAIHEFKTNIYMAFREQYSASDLRSRLDECGDDMKALEKLFDEL
ncbi:MAG: hypothetical protein WCK67_09850 [bacterium]